MNYTTPTFRESRTSWEEHHDDMLDYIRWMMEIRDRAVEELIHFMERHPEHEGEISDTILRLAETKEQYDREHASQRASVVNTQGSEAVSDQTSEE